MASQGSTLFTVGTLLNRAQDQGTPVRVLVEGAWIEGTPVASDGHGVILDNPEHGQYLVRTTSITVVLYLREHEADAPTSRTTADQVEETADPSEAARPGYAPAARQAVEAGSSSYA